MMPGRTRLYAILDVDRAAERGFAAPALLTSWLDAGVRLIQIRAKHHSFGPYLELATALADKAVSRGALLVVNDRADVARLSGASGVHVGQEDPAVEAARTLLLPPQIVGVSTHDRVQLGGALDERPDYLAYGPVYPTQSKENPDPVVGLRGLREAASMSARKGIPLVAIGGITLENAGDVLAAGASAVAVIGDLLVGNPARRAEEFLRRLEQ